MSSEDIKTEINFVASKINQFILNNISGEPFGLYTASLHYIKSGGKRLRPFMTIKTSELLNGNLQSSLPAAASVELIHNFTLVHDDIMDNDNVRHNVTTVHRQFGIPLAILAGDVLFSKAFQVISIYGKKVGLINPFCCGWLTCYPPLVLMSARDKPWIYKWLRTTSFRQQNPILR